MNNEHIKHYQQYIDVALELQTDQINSDNIEVNIVKKKLKAFSSVIRTCGFNPFTKPYWTPDFERDHQTKRSMRKRWVQDGRPRGTSHKLYKY